MTDMNKKQNKALKTIKTKGTAPIADFDLRTVNALVRRDFVKLITKKVGKEKVEFAKITAKGKKIFN